MAHVPVPQGERSRDFSPKITAFFEQTPGSLSLSVISTRSIVFICSFQGDKLVCVYLPAQNAHASLN